MKNFLFAVAALCLAMVPAHAANVTSNGVQGADGGQLLLDNTDQYWWFCAQPDGSLGPLAAGPTGYTADVVTLDYGWTRQTTNRFSFAGAATPAAQADLPLQINAIEYVLDTYLPWGTTTGRFEEFYGNADQTANVDFLNRFYASHQYVKALHGKLYDDNTAFTDLSVFTPVNPFAQDTAANTARHNYFNTIRDDIKAKDLLNTFNSYTALHDYALVNTFAAQGAPADWQDAIIIGAAVPEPTAGLLALVSASLLALRRRRA